MTTLGKTAGTIAMGAGIFAGAIRCDVSAAETSVVGETSPIPARNETDGERRSVAPAPEVIALLKQALDERRVIAFTYHGYTREAEPHALGVSKGGAVALLAYQIAGGSESEPPPGWRTFVVAEMGLLQLPVSEVERPPTGRNAADSGIAVKNSGPETIGRHRTFAAPRPSYRGDRTGLASVDAEVRAGGVVDDRVAADGAGGKPRAAEAGAEPGGRRRAKR